MTEARMPKAQKKKVRKLPSKISERHKKEISNQAAFINPEFMLGRDGRAVRILAEFLSQEHRFQHLKIEDTLVFFGSARTLPRRVAAANLRALRQTGPGPKSKALRRAELD